MTTLLEFLENDPFEENFFQGPNTWFDELPPKEFKLLTYLTNLPKGWAIQDSDLESKLGVGERQVRRVKGNLAEMGYAKRIRFIDPKGKNVFWQFKVSRNKKYLGDDETLTVKLPKEICDHISEIDSQSLDGRAVILDMIREVAHRTYMSSGVMSGGEMSGLVINNSLLRKNLSKREITPPQNPLPLPLSTSARIDQMVAEKGVNEHLDSTWMTPRWDAEAKKLDTVQDNPQIWNEFKTVTKKANNQQAKFLEFMEKNPDIQDGQITAWFQTVWANDGRSNFGTQLPWPGNVVTEFTPPLAGPEADYEEKLFKWTSGAIKTTDLPDPLRDAIKACGGSGRKKGLTEKQAPKLIKEILTHV